MASGQQTLLDGGISAEAAIAVAFLASPELQLALEKLEVAKVLCEGWAMTNGCPAFAVTDEGQGSGGHGRTPAAATTSSR